MDDAEATRLILEALFAIGADVSEIHAVVVGGDDEDEEEEEERRLRSGPLSWPIGKTSTAASRGKSSTCERSARREARSSKAISTAAFDK